jgi:hypothetical protein
MKHMASGTIAFIGVLALAGCYSYASEAINNGNYNTVQATPNFLVVHVGDSTQVIARLINDNANGAITDYTVSGTGSGILVHENLGYRPIFDSKLDSLVNTGAKTAEQFYIVGTAVGRYTFTLTPTMVNTGISSTVTAVVLPAALGTALSKHTGAPGDTIVITALAGTVFSQTSAVTFTTGTAAIVARAADSSSITIVISGGVTGPATVTKVGVIASPTVAPVSLVTTDSLVTTAEVFGAVLSTHSAAAGATVTITAPANEFFAQTSAISFPTGATSITSRSADGKTISFLVGPGITGPVTVTNVGLISAPTLPLLTFTSTDALTTTALSVAPTTVANAAPLIGVTTTVALGGGLRFLGTSHVFIGGKEAGIQSVSTDSTTATIVPMMGSTGVVSYTNIALSFLTSVPLALPGDQSITVGATYGGGSDPNAASFATASTITLRPTGATVISDTGPFTVASAQCSHAGDFCRFYKFVLTATTTYDADLEYPGGADMGYYRFNSAGSSAAGIADNLGQAPGNQPETGTDTNLAAGTYYIGIVYYGVPSYGAGVQAAPAFFQLRLVLH